MTRVLVLAALELEVRTLARALDLAPVPGSAWPRYQRGTLEVACVGLGATHLAARGEAGRVPTLVVSAGVCGALSPALAVGQLVVPEAVLTADGVRRPVAALPGVTARGVLQSTPHLIDSPAAKSRLWMESGALAVDMESGPIVEWARSRGLRAAVVRAVSDTADQVVPAELAAAITADGRLSPARAVRATLARPASLRSALALQRGTATALRSVARALASVAVQERGGGDPLHERAVRDRA